VSSTVHLCPVPQPDRDQLKAMITPYYAEIAPALPLPADMFLDRYWTDAGRTAQWIRANGLNVGFALTLTHPDNLIELVEFSITDKHRRQGLGRAAAHQLFDQRPGHWIVGVAARPPQTADFWRDCLTTCPTARQITRHPPEKPFECHRYDFISGPDT